MKYAIISDIHANLEALERALKDAAAQGAEQIVCLGDVVGYGPRPAETLEKIRATCAVVLAGNHDDAVSGRGDASAFIDLAADAVQRHRAALAEAGTRRDAASTWLKALPYTAEIDGAVCTHGDLVDPPKFYYVAEEKDAEANFAATDAQLVFVGHTHVPCLFLTGRSGTIYKTAPQDFTLEEGKRYIVNPGSVGYPRAANGQCLSSYVIYDSTERTVTYRFLPFSVASVMQRGQSPKRTKGARVALIAATLAAVLAGITAYFLIPRETVVEEDPALLLDTRTLALEPDIRQVQANLELAPGSVPIQLRVTFLDATDRTVKTESKSVASHTRAKINLPKDAKKVRFEALKVHADDRPTIKSFSPAKTARAAARSG